MSSNERQPDRDRPDRTRSGTVELLVRLRWPLTVIALGILALLAYRFTLRGTGELFDDAGETVRAVGRQIASIGERFRSGTITTTFVSSLPAVRGTGSGHLELATIEVEEILTATDERRIFWDQVSLGETTSEIRVPVVYRYHLRLGDPWEIEVRGQTCRVLAPPIRPSLPPAIDTERMRKRTESGWLRFDGEERLEALERSLTPTLAAYADDPRHVDLVREPARRTVAEFVRDWLLTEDHWREDRFRAIVVVFPDEIEDGFAVERPTLELELESR